MKPRRKKLLKVKLMYLLFVGVSFISVTLAWFAYSGLVKTQMNIDVKAWYIRLEKNDEPAENNMTISLNDIYPGMATVTEKVKIKNEGDADAQIKYEIASARLLNRPADEYTVDGVNTTSEYVEDKLSHDYPFHINMSLDKHYAVSKTGVSIFNVSISWPLDSGPEADTLDSVWGSAAYTFRNTPNETRPAIQVAITITAEQYVADNATSDTRFNLGDTIIYDPVNNVKCTTLEDSCITTKVFDINNTIGDTEVTLIPDLTNTFANGPYTSYETLISNQTSTWQVLTENLSIERISNLISKDVKNSFLTRTNLSDAIIGNLEYLSSVTMNNVSYPNRMNAELTKLISSSGYYKYLNESYPYLSSPTCFWLDNVDYNVSFAFEQIDATNSKISIKEATTNCNVMPLLIVAKNKLVS